MARPEQAEHPRDPAGGERRLLGVLGLAHAQVHVFELAYSAMLPELRGAFDLGLLEAGRIKTAYTFLFGAGALPSGWLSDRLGPRRVVAAYLVLACAGAAVVATAGDAGALLGGLLLLGAGLSLYHPAGTAYVAGSAAPVRRGRALGLHGVAGSAGTALAFLLPWALNRGLGLGWRGGFAALALPAVVALAALAFLPPPPARPGPATRGAVGPGRPGTLLLLFGSVFLTGLVYRGAITYMAELFRGAGEWTRLAGHATLLAALPAQLLGGRLADRYPLEGAGSLVLSLAGPALALVGLLEGGGRVAALAAFSFLFFLGQPIANALTAAHAPPGWGGRFYGLHFFVTFGLGSLGATLAGWWAERMGGLESAYGALGCGLALAAVLIHGLGRLDPVGPRSGVVTATSGEPCPG